MAALVVIAATWASMAAAGGANDAATDGTFAIAITVDDLPVHGPLPPGTTRLAIAQAHLDAFRAHGVREAFGFVNAGRMRDDPTTVQVLTAWRAAGHPLGNHGTAHMNLDRAPSIEAWQADVAGGETLLATQMRGRDWHAYRFPNLASGSDLVRRDAAAAYLRDRGYRVAQVSVAFSDWSYSAAYVRCLRRGDTAAIAAMKAAYLKGVDDGIARMKAVSMRTYGRIVPQVLLTHVGGWSAVTLPDVLARLEAAGARYVPLDQAQADPAYREAARLPGGGGIMDRTAAARHVALADLPRPSLLPGLSTICRADDATPSSDAAQPR